jgi:hypothetical protein
MPKSDAQLPLAKPQPKLIVLWAFDQGEDGELVPAWEAREMPDERRAVMKAKEIAHLHAGVLCWSREADPSAGEYGPSEVLYRHGSIPDLD